MAAVSKKVTVIPGMTVTFARQGFGPLSTDPNPDKPEKAKPFTTKDTRDTKEKNFLSFETFVYLVPFVFKYSCFLQAKTLTPFGGRRFYLQAILLF